jgi:hypothetical protein
LNPYPNVLCPDVVESDKLNDTTRILLTGPR